MVGTNNHILTLNLKFEDENNAFTSLVIPMTIKNYGLRIYDSLGFETTHFVFYIYILRNRLHYNIRTKRESSKYENRKLSSVNQSVIK